MNIYSMHTNRTNSDNPVYDIRIEIHRSELKKISEAVANNHNLDPELMQVSFRLQRFLELTQKEDLHQTIS